jgi:hypothetical protein
VRFRRAAGMQALPMPVSGGSIETLRSFLNVKTDSDFVLAVAWALACLRDRVVPTDEELMIARHTLMLLSGHSVHQQTRESV